jgi:TRAP-type mannitol/chloroaromatic compound transport system permease small subunit
VDNTEPTYLTWARGLVRACDGISEWTGKTASWLVWPLMLAITYEVVCRYALNAPTVWAYDMSYMIGGSMMALGMGYVLQERGHVRVDILYDMLSMRMRRLLDLIFTVLFFFPITAAFVYLSWQYALLAWVRGERSGYGIWEPTLIPFRSIVCVAWTVLLLAGIAWFTRTLVALVRGKDL